MARPRTTHRILATLSKALDHYRADLEFDGNNYSKQHFDDLVAAEAWVRGMQAVIKPPQKPVKTRKP